jgi:hypothetical protein
MEPGPHGSLTRTPAHVAGAKRRRMIKTMRKNISAAARRARSNMMSHKLLQGPIASYSL